MRGARYAGAGHAVESAESAGLVGDLSTHDNGPAARNGRRGHYVVMQSTVPQCSESHCRALCRNHVESAGLRGASPIKGGSWPGRAASTAAPVER
jgi:hypothetical protein